MLRSVGAYPLALLLRPGPILLGPGPQLLRARPLLTLAGPHLPIPALRPGRTAPGGLPLQLQGAGISLADHLQPQLALAAGGAEGPAQLGHLADRSIPGAHDH